MNYGKPYGYSSNSKRYDHNIFNTRLDNSFDNVTRKQKADVEYTSTEKSASPKRQNLNKTDDNINANGRDDTSTFFQGELICSHCYNRNMIENNQKKAQQNDKLENNPMLFNDRIKSILKESIQDKIRIREVLSQEASKSIAKYSTNEKEALQKKIESKYSMLYTNRDHSYDRAKQRNKFHERIIQNNIEKFVSPDKPEVAAYYSNYVYNTNESKANPTYEKTKEGYRNAYYKELAYQMKSNQIEKSVRKEKERLEEKSNLEKSIQAFKNDSIAKAQREKAKKDTLLYENVKLAHEKKRKEECEKEKEMKNYEQMIENLHKNQREHEHQMAEKKEVQRNDLVRGLNSQLNNRKMKDNGQNKDNSDNSNGFKLSCDHTGGVSCAMCSKRYPKQQLTRNVFKQNWK